jgi:N,N'-diacetyllegionaminate synthase
VSKVIIIAEAGVNHNGSIETAKELIDIAADCGVDIIKFQTFKAENLVSKEARLADYQTENMKASDNETQFEMLKKLELSDEDHIVLKQYCADKGIEFWSTAFDDDSLMLLKKLGISKWKIPSGDITNLPFLRKIGSYNQEVILSSGMSTLEEIKDAIHALTSAGCLQKNITVLHCNTEYPTPMHDVNLNAMLQIKNELHIKIGYSDHTEGIEVPIAAVALGATVIEKHFTLSKEMEGPDHKASLDPHKLKQMVAAIRNIELALGDGHKIPSASESKNKDITRKSIHLKHPLKAGHIITEDDLIMKRPGSGISPMLIDQIIGKAALESMPADYQLMLKDIS